MSEEVIFRDPVPARGDEIVVRGIGNTYGSLAVRQENGKPEWSVEDYNGYVWEPCPQDIYDSIVKHYGKGERPMSNELKLRVGDVVRLKPLTVKKVDDDHIRVYEIDWIDCWFNQSLVEEIISRAETPEEELERLRAELASVPRKIEWGGGSCPTDKAVVIWQRNGKTSQAMGYAFDWRHRSEPDDIIAYMELPQ